MGGPGLTLGPSQVSCPGQHLWEGGPCLLFPLEPPYRLMKGHDQRLWKHWFGSRWAPHFSWVPPGSLGGGLGAVPGGGGCPVVAAAWQRVKWGAQVSAVPSHPSTCRKELQTGGAERELPPTPPWPEAARPSVRVLGFPAAYSAAALGTDGSSGLLQVLLCAQPR